MIQLKKLIIAASFGALMSLANSCLALDLPFFSNTSDEASTTRAANTEESSKNSWSSSAQEIILHALSQTGVKYKYGGINPETGFDCSGFVRYVFQQAANLTLPHGARAISQVGENVSQSDLQPGDLVFFNTLRSVTSHVGIYVGNNRFIHSPSAGGTISVTDMNDAYWSKHYTGARRIQEKDIPASEEPLKQTPHK